MIGILIYVLSHLLKHANGMITLKPMLFWQSRFLVAYITVISKGFMLKSLISLKTRALIGVSAYQQINFLRKSQTSSRIQ